MAIRLQNNKKATFSREYDGVSTTYTFTRPSKNWKWISLSSTTTEDYEDIIDADENKIKRGIIRFGSMRPYVWYAMYVYTEDYNSGHPNTDYKYFNIRVRIECRMYRSSAYIYCPPYTCVWTMELQNKNGRTLKLKSNNAAKASVNIQDNGENFLATADQGAEMALTAVKRPTVGNKVKIVLGSKGSGSEYDCPENTTEGTPATGLRIQNILGSIEIDIEPPYTDPALKIQEINGNPVSASSNRGYSSSNPLCFNANQSMTFTVDKCGEKPRDKYKIHYEYYINYGDQEITYSPTDIAPNANNDYNTTRRSYPIKNGIDIGNSGFHNNIFGIRAHRIAQVNNAASTPDKKYVKFLYYPIVPVMNLSSSVVDKTVSLSWNFPDYNTVGSVTYGGTIVNAPYGICNGYRISLLLADANDKVIRTYIYHTKSISGVSFTIPNSDTTSSTHYLGDTDSWSGYTFVPHAKYKIKVEPFFDGTEYTSCAIDGIIYGPSTTITIQNPIKSNPPKFTSGIDYPINGETWVGNKLYVCFTLPKDDQYIAYKRELWNESHKDENGNITSPYNESEWMTDKSYKFDDCIVTVNGQSFSFTGNSNMFSCVSLGYNEKVLFSTRLANVNLNYTNYGSLTNKISVVLRSSDGGDSDEISTNIYCRVNPYNPTGMNVGDLVKSSDFNNPSAVVSNMARCYAVYKTKTVNAGDFIYASDFDDVYNILLSTYNTIVGYPTNKNTNVFPGFKTDATPGGTYSDRIIKNVNDNSGCYFKFIYNWINNFH